MTTILWTTTLIWACGLLGYWLLLRPLAAHDFNRVYLLALSLVGLILPWVPVRREANSLVPSVAELPAIWLAEVRIGASPSQASVFDDLSIWAWVYGLGVLVSLGLIARAALQLARCFRESRPAQPAPASALEVRQTALADSPFSFGRTLFVGDWADFTEDDRGSLLRHEEAHWRLGHRFDNALTTAIGIVAWFHPLAHLLRRELRLVHEYQADQAALRSSDTQAYRRLLLAQQFDYPLPMLVAPFAGTPLQNRFAMMTKTFHRLQAWRLAVAALALVVLAVACTKEDISSADLAQLAAAQTEAPTVKASLAELMARVEAGELELRADTIKVFNPETYESETKVEATFFDLSGKVVYRLIDVVNAEYTSRGSASKITPTALSQVVRGQEVYNIVDEMPEFPGAGCAAGDRECSQAALLQFMYSNLKYPATAKDESIEGKVIVSFVVGTDGELLEPSILKSPDARLSEEVLRLLDQMPAWRPGRHGEKDVQVSFVLPVVFAL